MTFNNQNDPLLYKFYENTWAELRRAIVDKKHSFRYFVLASVYEAQVYQRTLALRGIDERQYIWAYTDFRTPKIKQLQLNPSVSLLFFHPKKWLQIRIEAFTEIHYQDKDTAQVWKNISIHSQKDYTTMLSPGSTLESAEEIKYLPNEENYFCRLSFEPQNVEILQIRREGHLRAKFELQNADWKGAWLVP